MKSIEMIAIEKEKEKAQLQAFNPQLPTVQVDEKKKAISQENPWKQALRISTSNSGILDAKSSLWGEVNLGENIDLKKKIIFLLQIINNVRQHGENIRVSWNGKSSALVSNGEAISTSCIMIIRCLNLYVELKDKNSKKADEALSFAAAHAPTLGSRIRGQISAEGTVGITRMLMWQFKTAYLVRTLVAAPVFKK